jgi:hypothetical protein
MKCEVTLFVGGKTFKETVEATSYESARRTAIQRNPDAKVIGVTAVFK